MLTYGWLLGAPAPALTWHRTRLASVGAVYPDRRVRPIPYRPHDRIDAGSSHNTREWGDWYYLYGCRVLDTHEWGEWRHLDVCRVLAMVCATARNFRPTGDDRVLGSEHDGLYFV